MVATWTDRVYMASFGEEEPHFHAMLLARNVPVSVTAHTAMYEQMQLLAPRAAEADAGAQAVAAWLHEH